MRRLSSVAALWPVSRPGHRIVGDLAVAGFGGVGRPAPSAVRRNHPPLRRPGQDIRPDHRLRAQWSRFTDRALAGASLVGGLSGATAGFLYNATNCYLVQPLDPYNGIVPTIVTGVGYRTDTNQTPSVPQLVLSGLAYAPFTTKNCYTAWLTADGGTNWDYAYQPYNGAKNATVPLANSLAGR